MPRVRVSIALATWNGEHFLKEQLDSYLTQSRLPDELVVSDDNSKDKTLQVVYEFARHAPFAVRVLQNKERQGYAKNFQMAIERCSGDVILLSDQDDIWLPTHIEKLVSPFECRTTGASAIVLTLSRSRHFKICEDGSRVEWDIAQNPLRRWNWRVCQRDGLIAGFVRHWEPPFAGHGIAFSAKLLPVVIPVAADYHDFWIDSLASALGDFQFIDEVLTLHRVHNRNTAGYGHKKRITPKVGSPDVFSKEIERLKSFVIRLEGLDNLNDRGRRSLRCAKRAIRALERRQAARRRGLCGIPGCVAGLLCGDYHASGLGFVSFCRDLFDIVVLSCRKSSCGKWEFYRDER